MDSPIEFGVAAGWCKTPHHVGQIAKTPITHIFAGSVVTQRRDGNPGDVLGKNDRGGGLNSLGMPYEPQELRDLVTAAHDAGKQIIINVAGFSPEEYGELANAAYEAGSDGVELNFGCPNVRDGGQQKPIMSFDEHSLQASFSQVDLMTPSTFPVFSKLSPYSNPNELIRVANLISDIATTGNWNDRPMWVTTSNTFANAYAFRPGTTNPLLTAGYGGFSGPGYKPIALGQVRQFSEHLFDCVGIVGVGDIQTGQDILEYQTCGASMFQIGSAFMHDEDFRVFERVLMEYLELTST